MLYPTHVIRREKDCPSNNATYEYASTAVPRWALHCRRCAEYLCIPVCTYDQALFRFRAQEKIAVLSNSATYIICVRVQRTAASRLRIFPPTIEQATSAPVYLHLSPLPLLLHACHSPGTWNTRRGARDRGLWAHGYRSSTALRVVLFFDCVDVSCHRSVTTILHAYAFERSVGSTHMLALLLLVDYTAAVAVKLQRFCLLF